MDIISQLKELKLTIAEKEHTEAKLKALKSRESELGSNVTELRGIMEYECADVEKLEKLGTVSLFYSFIGKKVEKLDEEKREAALATEKYKLAVAELEDVSKDIEKCEKVLRNIRRCEEKYDELWKGVLEQKINGEAGESENSELQALNEQSIQLEARIKNTDEAISEGDKLFLLIDKINVLLCEYCKVMRSRNSSTAEVIEAHENLKRADNMLSHMNGQISRFRAELADVGLEFDMQNEIYDISIVGASNCFANMFVFTEGDYYKTSDRMNRMRSELSKTLHRLAQRRERLQKNAESVREKMNKIISS